jgi:hypothetical protein
VGSVDRVPQRQPALLPIDALGQERGPEFISVVRDADRQPLSSESKPATFGIAMERRAERVPAETR